MSDTNIKNNIRLLPWLIPFIALVATIWLIYKSINEAGVEIVVNFKNGSTLKENKTFVKYKGFNVGKVTKIEIAKDLNSVNAHIKLKHNVADLLAREGSVFWIVEAKVSINEISGLDTIITGSYIEARLNNNNKDEITKVPKKYTFTAEPFKPLKYYSESGINIILQGNSKLNIQKGTPILYKKIETGKVIGTKLINDEVKIFVNIYDKYKDLINSSTVFYKSGGIKLQAGLDGIDLELDSFASLLSGGISFETINQKAKKISKDSTFKLYENYKKVGLNQKQISFEINDAKDLKINKTAIVYKGLKVGKISDIEDMGTYLKVDASIDEKYEKYLSNKTKFYIVKSNLQNFDLQNIDTLVKGTYITFIPKKGEYEDKFKLYESYEKLEFNDMLKVRLKANKFSNLNIGSEIYYKNVVIGRVVSQDFEKSFTELLINIVIEKKYKKLLNDKTMFYIISTPLVETKNLDIKVNFERVKPFIFGGIGLEYIPSDSKIQENRYWLYDSYLELQEDQKKYIKGHRLKVKLDDVSLIKEDIDILYNGVKIGYIEKIKRLAETPYAIFFIENQYKSLIKEYSKFYYENGIELSAGLDGINFKMHSLSSLLKGSIALSNKHKEKDTKLAKFNYKLYKDYESIPFKRFKINLVAKNSYDLKNASKIFYKGIEVGKVSKTLLSDDLNKVIIEAYLYDEFKKLSYGTPYYYVLKTDISLKGIKGIKNLIKGTSINLLASKDRSSISNNFILNDSSPKVSLYKKGIVYKLFSKSNIDLSTSSKVYYKKVEIGEVDNIYLSSDSTNTIADILIYDKYKNLVRDNSIFYESSGIDVDISLLGADIKADTLSTILYGGVFLFTPNDKKDIAKENTKFILQKDKDKKWKDYNPSIKLN